MILIPTGMTVIEWTDAMSLLIRQDNTSSMKLEDPERWRDWASNVNGEPDLVGQNTPDPYQFEDWRDWAMRFNQTVELPG